MSLVAGVLVDDAIVEIENIVRHMRMGKSAYQASIDAADEIGLAVLATTMSIVAVFLPVALMPGISGQFFKAFGFTVVVSVLMSLLVARMITPLVAAYFLRSHGVQPHAACKWMDVYLKALKWSLDSTKAVAFKAGLRKVPGKFLYYCIGAILLLVVIGAFLGGTGAAFAALGKLGLATWQTFLLAQVAGAALAYGVGKLIGLIVRVIGGGFGGWHAYVTGRWDARLRDHRMAMVGAGIATLVLTIVLFMTLSMTFQPPLNLDFSRGHRDPAARSDAQADRGGADRVAEIVKKDPDVERVFERVRVGTGDVNIVLKKDREKTSTEFERNTDPGASGDRRRASQFPEPERRRARRQRARHHALSGRRRPRASCSRSPTRSPTRWQTIPGLRAPRVGGDLVRPGDRDQAALRPRRRSRRDHRRAEPDDPHRDARRHRAEQRQILAGRPPGADHRVAVGECAARHLRRSRICRCRRRAAARCR